MSESEELDRLVEITANLKAHIDDQAEAIAGPRIVRVKRRAEKRVSELERAHGFEVRRLNDLVDELRRQLAAVERQVATTGAASLKRAAMALPDDHAPGCVGGFIDCTCHVNTIRQWLHTRAANLTKETTDA